MIFYTDGSCLGNGKSDAVGGYGVVGVNDEDKVEFVRSKRSNGTTNNREELKAILYVMLHYCVNTLNDWMFGWARRGWVKSDKKTPENLDLIQAYFELYKEGYRIDLRKIKGHAGHEWNELADQLATGYISEDEAYATYS